MDYPPFCYTCPNPLGSADEIYVKMTSPQKHERQKPSTQEQDNEEEEEDEEEEDAEALFNPEEAMDYIRSMNLCDRRIHLSQCRINAHMIYYNPPWPVSDQIQRYGPVPQDPPSSV